MEEQKILALKFTRSLLSDVLDQDIFQDRSSLDQWARYSSSDTLDLYESLDKRDPDFFGGLFVTLRISDNLRGCIGRMWNEGSAFTILPYISIETALHDYRFKPLTRKELEIVTISHSILSVPHLIDTWKSIRLHEQGIIFSLGRRRAVFLPEVPTEQGWSLEETLEHLSKKAGLPSQAYDSEEAEFKVFTSFKYEE